MPIQWLTFLYLVASRISQDASWWNPQRRNRIDKSHIA